MVLTPRQSASPREVVRSVHTKAPPLRAAAHKSRYAMHVKHETAWARRKRVAGGLLVILALAAGSRVGVWSASAEASLGIAAAVRERAVRAYVSTSGRRHSVNGTAPSPCVRDASSRACIEHVAYCVDGTINGGTVCCGPPPADPLLRGKFGCNEKCKDAFWSEEEGLWSCVSIKRQCAAATDVHCRLPAASLGEGNSFLVQRRWPPLDAASELLVYADLPHSVDEAALLPLLEEWGAQSGGIVGGHEVDFLALSPTKQREYAVLWGHRRAGLHRHHEYLRDGRAVRYVAIVRDPLTRTVAQWSAESMRIYGGAERSTALPLVAWLRSGSRTDLGPWNQRVNPLAHELCCWWVPSKMVQRKTQLEECPSDLTKLVQCAKESLDAMVAVGIYERFDDSLALLRHRTGLNGGGGSISRAKGAAATDATHNAQLFQHTPTAAEEAQLRIALEIDLELYAYARAVFEEQFATMRAGVEPQRATPRTVTSCGLPPQRAERAAPRAAWDGVAQREWPPLDTDKEMLDFVHLPKTAGSVVKQWLMSWSARSGLKIGHDRENFLALSRDEQQARVALWGHRGFGVHEQVGWKIDKMPRYITFVRDPINRTLSQYEFECRALHRDCPDCTKPRFLDWFHDHLSGVDGPWSQQRNPMTRQLCCWWTEHGERPAVGWPCPADEDEMLQCAKRNLDRFFVVGVQEHFEEGMQVLVSRTGIEDTRRVEERAVNVGPKSGTHTLSADESAIVRASLRNDVLLHEYAERLFRLQYLELLAGKQPSAAATV